MNATPSQASAIVRQRLSDMAAHESDPAIYAVLRELIRATDPAKHFVLVTDKRVAA